MLSTSNLAIRKLRIISKETEVDGYENMLKQPLENILTKPSSSMMVVILNKKVRRKKSSAPEYLGKS